MYYLVLRPLLEFNFSLCGVCSMPLRWKNALIMISIIVLALWLKKKIKRNVLLNVVQIALEMLCFFVFCFVFVYFLFCFFKESTNLSDGPSSSSRWQMGIKWPANHRKMSNDKKSPSCDTVSKETKAAFFFEDLNVNMKPLFPNWSHRKKNPLGTRAGRLSRAMVWYNGSETSTCMAL